MLRPGIAEAGDQKVHRCRSLSPAEEAHRSVLGGGCVLVRGLGGFALGALRPLLAFALDSPFLELRETARNRAGGEHQLRIVEKGDALDRGQVLDAQRDPDLERRDVELHVLGDAGRESLELHLAADELNDAALLRARRLADELEADRGLDRAVETHLVEVDVGERAADRVALEVLEDGVMGRRLPLDHDVDDRVEPRRAGQRGPKAALVHDDRARVTLPVEDARHQTLLAKAAHAAGAELLDSALGDLQGDTIARHRRAMVAEADCTDRHATTLRAQSGIERPSASNASCFTLATGKPAAQRRLLREAERTRDAQARLVGGVDPDLDAVDAADADRDPRERGRRFARIAATDRRGTDPVADLERSLAGARVEPRAADGLAFVAREDAVDEVLAEIEPPPKAPQEPDPLVERPGLVVCPRHPGTEVVEAGVDRVREERCIARVPAAEHEPLCADQVRGRWVVDARQWRDATSRAPSLNRDDHE